MKFDDATMAKLMEYIEASGLDGASFDDTKESLNARYPTMPPQTGTTKEKVGMSISERNFYLSLMFDDGLVKGSRTKNGALGLMLTSSGHLWIKSYRNNTWVKRLSRWMGRVTDRAFSSILLPVFVSVLTVWALKYFGLDGQ